MYCTFNEDKNANDQQSQYKGMSVLEYDAMI